MSPFLLVFLGNFLPLNYVFSEVASIMGEFSHHFQSLQKISALVNV
jgi:hypothetical protein